MARSIVRWRGEADGSQEFDVDIGRNAFYAWAVGSGSDDRNGVQMLKGRTQTSSLLGPLGPGTRGRAVLRVPSDSFSEQDHHLQMLSFRDEDLRGPAASDLVDVPWRWSRDSVARPARRPAPRPRARTEPIGQESTASLSQSQFLEALAGLLPQLLPLVQQVLPAVGPLLGSLFGGGAAAPAPAAGSVAPTGAPDLGQLMSNLLAQVRKLIAPAAAAPAALPAPPVATGAPQQASMSVPGHYSTASIAPLLAALPALMPLLQQVLTPQTVQSLISAGDPTKMLQTGINGVMEAAKLGQEATDKLHALLKSLNPGLGDDVLIPLLASMSLAPTDRGRRPSRYTISSLVRLGVADLAPVELGGYPQVAFRVGDQISLPVTVETPRAIPRATLRATVKEAGTLRPVAERSWTFPRLESGRLPEPTTLPTGLTQRLTAGGEYLVDLALTWQGRRGLVGASTSQLIRLVGEATFDSMDTGGPPVRLDDVDRDRDWWHRVHADAIDERTSRVDADLVYSYRLAHSPTGENERLHTDVALDQHGGRWRGEMRSGLNVSLAQLSRLADRLTGTAFTDEVVRGLSDPSFARAFDRSAHARVSLRGRRGAQTAVWVWPEVKVHTVLLQVPGDVSPLTGQVMAFEAVPVKVPVPGLAHVVSTRSS